MLFAPALTPARALASALAVAFVLAPALAPGLPDFAPGPPDAKLVLKGGDDFERTGRNVFHVWPCVTNVGNDSGSLVPSEHELASHPTDSLQDFNDSTQGFRV